MKWIKNIFYMMLFTVMICAQIDYQSQVQLIFNTNCVGCHGGSSGVTLSTYAKTMASIGLQYGTAIIVPGNKDASPIWDKINPNPSIGVVMPYNNLMDEEKRNIIGQWIDEGALLTATAIEADPRHPDQFSVISCHPNPFNTSTTVQLTLPGTAEVLFRIVDLRGKLIFRKTEIFTEGRPSISIDLTEQPSGVYLLQTWLMNDDQDILLGVNKITLLK
jgi:hypothetical protein